MATTKQDLVDLICAKNDGMTKKAATELLDAVFDKITDSIKTESKFTFPGFGTFEIRTRRARQGVNPRNPSEKISIPETKNVGFTASKALKDQIGA
ncbi:MAG: HU family DNA-binding protein [Deltaproteobacteria bacterium]|nr:HU family DNA-binding protein [Deltaproteobacteria bacterium]